MAEQLNVRYICEMGEDEILVEASCAEEAAEKAADILAKEKGAGTYTFTVSEANEYDLPLIAGDDYTVTVA